MIRYSLACDHGHAFDGWFSSGADFDSQGARNLVSCPSCGSTAIAKQLMTPSVASGRLSKDDGKVLVMDPERKQAVAKIREIVTAIRDNAQDVGTDFPEEARKIHYGEAQPRGLIGQARPDEARALIEEGIQIAALPVLPDDVN